MTDVETNRRACGFRCLSSCGQPGGSGEFPENLAVLFSNVDVVQEFRPCDEHHDVTGAESEKLRSGGWSA